MTAVTPLHGLLVRHEGLKTKPYLDTVGKTTIGVGRNLDDVGVSPDEAMVMLDNDIVRIRAAVRQVIPSFDSLSQARQDALVDMAFMGPSRLLEFKTMLFEIGRQNWAGAADAMLASRWAGQVGVRAAELAEMMRNERYPG